MEAGEESRLSQPLSCSPEHAAGSGAPSFDAADAALQATPQP